MAEWKVDINVTVTVTDQGALASAVERLVGWRNDYPLYDRYYDGVEWTEDVDVYVTGNDVPYFTSDPEDMLTLAFMNLGPAIAGTAPEGWWEVEVFGDDPPGAEWEVAVTGEHLAVDDLAALSKWLGNDLSDEATALGVAVRKAISAVDGISPDVWELRVEPFQGDDEG